MYVCKLCVYYVDYNVMHETIYVCMRICVCMYACLHVCIVLYTFHKGGIECGRNLKFQKPKEHCSFTERYDAIHVCITYMYVHHF